MEKKHHFFAPLAMLFVTTLLTANVLGPKPILIGTFVFPAGLLVFPMTYLIGAILSEVYGFQSSRKVIWFGLLCNLFIALACRIAIYLPYESSWTGQMAYEETLGVVSRLMFVSILTYFLGELINTWIIGKLKEKFEGKLFFIRGLCGNWIGEGVETFLFFSLAFSHLSPELFLKMATNYYLFKMTYSFLAMPFVQLVIFYLEKAKRPSLNLKWKHQ